MSDLLKQAEGLSEQKRRLLLHRLMQQQGAALAAQPPNTAPAKIEKIQNGTHPTPVIMIHPTSGVLSFYMELSKELAGYTVYGISKSGRITDGDETVTFEDMAADYAQLIRTAHPKGPYLLSGFCVGGTIAYEVARQLTAEGGQVQAVVMLDSFPPRNVQNERIFLLWLFYDAMAGRGRFSMNIPYQEFHARYADAPIEAALEFISGEIKQHAQVTMISEVPELLSAYRIFDEVSGLYNGYKPGTPDFRTVLIRPQEVVSVNPLISDDRLTWGQYAPDMELRRIPGKHYAIMEAPYVTGLAAEFKQILEEGEPHERFGGKTAEL